MPAMPDMKPIAPQDRRVANIHEAVFQPYVYPDGRADGDAVLQLSTDTPLGLGFHVYRMAPGMTTRAHQHRGDEQFLVLEGELFDNDGTRYRAGDLVWLRDGTQHSSYTATGCLLAVHIAGPETSLE
jgi:anti-sigma factor ChrR (cupin superfamily)